MALTESGLYYVARDGTDMPARFAIFFYDFATRQITGSPNWPSSLRSAPEASLFLPTGARFCSRNSTRRAWT